MTKEKKDFSKVFLNFVGKTRNVMIKNILPIAIALLTVCTATAQHIDRKPIVERNNPHIDKVDTLSSFTVGNGHFAVTVDATGLQTYPEYYSNGIPLGTFSDWAWHSFPNTNGYKAEEALVNHDFGRGHEELYSAEFKQKGRQRDASNWLRANPNRMHLGCLGFDFGNTPRLKNVHQKLDMWTGMVASEFDNDGYRYNVETVCHPERDFVAVRINRKSDEGKTQKDDNGHIRMRFRFPYPTGKHSDDGCDWTFLPQRQSVSRVGKANGTETLRVQNDSAIYYIYILCRDKAGRVIPANGRINGNEYDFTVPDRAVILYGFASNGDALKIGKELSFKSIEKASAQHWKSYWRRGGIVDFSRVSDKRARELERRTVLSQYLLAVNDSQDYPPAETGLTYNSWFGKFHLEMIYWHQAWQALWGHPEMLEHTLQWYFRAEPMAREIARRQGFKGVRWMKMTDTSAAEAPSNVGSYLIWQQPHIIYLAELLYRATHNDSILHKYARLVDETAEFMADFCEFDSLGQQYIIRGYIPAQETMKADSVRNSPFELSYWLTALGMAQQWRVRLGEQRVALWDDIINRLEPLPSASPQDSALHSMNKEMDVSVYTVAEGAPLISNRAAQTDSPNGDDKFASDHPMPLGAYGMLPESRLFTISGMNRTYNWIMSHWNWQKTWGWDYPMTAMCAVRLDRPDDAVNALLMNVPKNTYLNNGHNWQSSRLRCYLPGNGGLLTAIALMCAGWDGYTTNNPGFPKGWDVRWEGLLPLP